MKNKISWSFVLSLLITACSLVSSPSAPKYKTGGVYAPEAAYDKASAEVSAAQESTVELSDGAEIVIPANSLTSDASITIERNAAKTSSLPPLGDLDYPLSDFYNFQVEGGELIGAVDLLIPFDESKLPKADGFLVAMIPTESGWEYIPVEAYGNKADLYTSELGDPLIAWHFTCTDNINLGYPGHADPCAAERARQQQANTLCDPTIPANAIFDQQAKTVQITGRLVPLGKKYLGFIDLKPKPAANRQVKIGLNTDWVDGKTYMAVTDSDGRFSLTLDATDPSTGLHDGWNTYFMNASCDSWPGGLNIVSHTKPGGISFILNLNESSQVEVAPTLTESSTPQSQQTITPPQSPTDKIPVPNAIGMTFEDAQKTLEDLGFNTIWIDGKSNLELGKIYSQEPVAGILSVPHRTTVVIYRTTEVDTTPTCVDLKLTPEECVNAMAKEYEITCKSNNEWANSSEHKLTCECSTIINPVNQDLKNWTLSSLGECKKVSTNVYSCADAETDHVKPDTWTITYTMNGFIEELDMYCDDGTCGCHQLLEYTITK